MAFDPVSSILEIGSTAISRIWPDPIRQAEEQRKLAELAQSGDLERLNTEVKLLLGQLEINKVEASSKSLFVAGWRPAVGWLCVTVMAFNYIGVYLLEYCALISVAAVEPPVRMDMSELWPVLLGMLGLGGMRSYDKKNKTQTDKL